jgi:hypothetical protein
VHTCVHVYRVCVYVHAMLRDEKSCIRTHSWFILNFNVVSLQVEDSSMIIGFGHNIKINRSVTM